MYTFFAHASLVLPHGAITQDTESFLLALQKEKTASLQENTSCSITKRSDTTLRIAATATHTCSHDAQQRAFSLVTDIMQTLFLFFLEKNFNPIAQNIQLYQQQNSLSANPSTPHHNKPEVAALILVGGKSSRMGKDKATLLYNNTPYIEKTTELLQSLFSTVALSVREDQHLNYQSNLTKIYDRFLHFGPLSGILSALYHSENTAWFVLPSDLPNVTENTIKRLLLARENAPQNSFATAFFNTKRNQLEPLCAIYEPQALSILLHYLSQKISCPTALLRYLNTHSIHIDSHELDNINTPQEYLTLTQS